MASLNDAVRKSAISLTKALKRSSPYKTGALRKSIEVEGIRSRLTLDMLYYGPILDKSNRTRHKNWATNIISRESRNIEANIEKELARQIKKAFRWLN